jgi:malate dehydrogenase (oxaloacetate-decarboxylating)
MKRAAATAIAESVGSDLSADMIVPGVFDRRVPLAVAYAVSEAARADGVARV